MSGILLFDPVLRAVDANGAPISGALLQFYSTGTTTPASVYSSSALSTPLANPVVADGGGLFVPIFLDPSVTYRCQLQSATGAVIRDVDPITGSVTEATQAQVNAGTASGIYVSPAKLAAWSGLPSALGYTPVNRAGDTATNLLLANTVLAATSAGYLGAPINEQDGNYTLALSDAGKLIRANSAAGIAWTIPPNASVALPVGTVIVLRNVGAGTVTITRGAGVTQTIAGAATNKDVALAQNGMASLIQEAANVWLVSGTGVS
ncbi:MAG: hypothetical protein ACYC8V_06735 [Caulobacteraceae bacterium]